MHWYLCAWMDNYTYYSIYTCTAEKAMEYERFGNSLTNARQKSRYIFGQNLTDLVYMDRRYNLLTAFMPGSN